MSKTITVEFENEEQAECFTDWLSESGEQDYFIWAEMREGEKGEDYVNSFSYKDDKVIGTK